MLDYFQSKYSFSDPLLCLDVTEQPPTFETFDRAYREEDGGYKITGRDDDIFAIGEHHYDPSDLENTLVCLDMQNALVDVHKYMYVCVYVLSVYQA